MIKYLIILLCLVTSLSLIGEVYASNHNEIDHDATYFEPIITYDETTIPWKVSITCQIIKEIPDTFQSQMAITNKIEGGYLYNDNGLTFELPNIKIKHIEGSCKISKAKVDEKYEPFLLYIRDSDQDTIVDITDLCPLDPEDNDGYRDKDGCPDDLVNTPTDTTDDVNTISLDKLQKNKSNGGCSDCTPPTLGLDKSYKRVVDNGFSYNGQTVQVEKWYTEFPLINATVGIPNLVEIKVYENHGINNMKWVQFCLGAEERGQSLDSCEVLIEVHLLTDGTTTGVIVDNIVIKDKDNLIDNDSVSAVSYPTLCMDERSSNCTKVDLNYTYREETINHMMIVNVVDKARNSQNFHLNEGVNVLGESLNEPPSITLYNKNTSQQTDDLWITYTRTDKRTDTWFDESGIEYHRINDYLFDRITPPEPYKCNDPPLDEVKVWKRTNCHFRALTGLWD